MNRLSLLKSAKTKPDLARILGVKPSTLTHCLYIVKPENQYVQFEIPKRNGAKRVIRAPSGMLKNLQSSLSDLLLDCLDEIIFLKFPDSEITSQKAKNSLFLKVKCSSSETKQPSLSHGFERKRSIITNAMMHLGKKHVFNIDLENFFGSFNFGRVRGFFIKNGNFLLEPEIATVIAKIACYNNELPQGSPCSPVISNLITHALDIKLAAVAAKHSCTYTRYADDITFSTRKGSLPSSVAKSDNHTFVAGKVIRREIVRSGFSINESKTRDQYKDSRQEVTGLVVNKKPNTKKEYWRLVRAQCNHLFNTGEFKETINGAEVTGNIHRLEGKLTFIDQVDHYNRLRQGEKLNPKYHLKKDAIRKSNPSIRRYLHTSRETTFSKFLFYRWFYGNTKPTILTEGQTDNIYLKSAIWKLAVRFPKLATGKSATEPYKALTQFFKYNERTRYLLELFGGGDYLRDFVANYKELFNAYKAPKPSHPVIIFVDNDSGPNNLINEVKRVKGIHIFPAGVGVADIRQSEFVHIFCNLYLVLTPQGAGSSETDIEYFFSDADRLREHKGKRFNTIADRDKVNDLSKEAFATHIVKAQKGIIDFSRFTHLLERIEKVIDHYNSIK